MKFMDVRITWLQFLVLSLENHYPVGKPSPLKHSQKKRQENFKKLPNKKWQLFCYFSQFFDIKLLRRI